MSQEVKVHVMNIALISDEEISVVKHHFPKRYAKAKEMGDHDDYLRSIGGSYLINQTYPDVDEEDIKYNSCGKPYINGKFFNISHDGGYVVLAESSTDVGVDICDSNRHNEEVMIKTFSQEEQFLCSKFSTMFAKLWSQKESVIKLFGDGLSRDLKSINVVPFERNRPTPVDDKMVYNKTVDYNNYFISVSSFNDISVKVLDSVDFLF